MKNNSLANLAFAGFVSLALLGGCQKEFGGGTDEPHRIRVFLTDHQTPVFDSVFVDLQRLEIRLEDDSLPDGGWISLSIRPGIYNILRFRNGLDTLFASGTIPGSRLKKLRLTLGTQNSAMKDGQSFPLRVHDSDRQVEMDLEPGSFAVNGGEVLFWLDFDASRSIQIDNSGSGNNNGYRLRSHLRVFTHANAGRIEGRVLPAEATPLVHAALGNDTSTAIPEADGRFRIVGLRPGIYSLLVDGHNNYQDTLVRNVIVRSGEETSIGSIILRR